MFRLEREEFELVKARLRDPAIAPERLERAFKAAYLHQAVRRHRIHDGAEAVFANAYMYITTGDYDWFTALNDPPLEQIIRTLAKSSTQQVDMLAFELALLVIKSMR